jgi:hypothetical protein
MGRRYSITMQCKVERKLLVLFVGFDLDKDLLVFNRRKREIRYLLSDKRRSMGIFLEPDKIFSCKISIFIIDVSTKL